MSPTSQHDLPAPAPAHPDAELGFELAKPARFSAGRWLAVLVVIALVLGGGFVASYLPRRAARAELVSAAASRSNALLRVAFVKPKLVSNQRTLMLPGNVQALEEATIYPRASGYVRRWLVDIGAHVKADELLAEIETPELDQELSQARAALAQARANVLQAQANRGLATTRLERTGKLVEAGVSAQQDLDQTKAESAVGDADLKVAEANVAAQQANIRRLGDLQGFSRVTAPFAGTITERSIDRGSLVAAGSVSSPLFKLASTDTVRVFVQVPQDAAPSITLDAPAELRIGEYPNRKFLGKIARTSGALDAATRTLSVEVRVPNPDGKLLVGMYADVKLTLVSERRVFELPATVLLNDAAGLRIAVVSPNGTVHLQPLQLERDLGATLLVASGLDGSERIVQIAGVELEEGQKVDAVAAVVPTAPASASASVPSSAPGSAPSGPTSPLAAPRAPASATP